ncbi:MAG TPA: hypothetical protein VFP58_07755 [Candidatus Eisenbacteria bacterium]|nr:hypothetical protein [Candidatus Eisenbacteria bacterium]
MPQSVTRPDPSRLAEGWEPRFVVEARRVPEYVDLYASLGFEVVADPVRPDPLAAGCGDCRIAILLDFRVIYTRRLAP